MDGMIFPDSSLAKGLRMPATSLSSLAIDRQRYFDDVSMANMFIPALPS